jgi:lipopolysaccharide/colanic/teichoic acid biosynthesis glycosyltransferase
MAIIALAIKLYDGGPVFFKQKRCTLDGKVFEIHKFRSMIVDAEKEGISIPATDKDPRITPVGNVIRMTRLDELPQVFDILIGNMSIVGPRPERVEHVEKYTKEVPEFAYRLKVKGGLTGYAQIYGKYNTTPYDKLKLDLMYIQNYSILLDLKLILMTVKIIFMKESTEGFKEGENNKDE